MPNRILRGELLESESWLALKDNADRSAWVACFLTADVFGDMPAGPLRLLKLWRPYGIDTVEKVAKVFSELCDVDLLRRYEFNGKPYLHIPRFKQSRRYLGYVWPLSPWATASEKQRLAQKPRADHSGSQEGSRDTPGSLGRTGKDTSDTGELAFCQSGSQGNLKGYEKVSGESPVGVGVGVGVEPKDIVGLAPDGPSKFNGKIQKTRALNATAVALITFLNEKTGARYQSVPANVKLIVARLQEGFSEKEIRQVIANRCLQWIGDPKMDEFLRPKTLFNATNFANYAGLLGKKTEA